MSKKNGFCDRLNRQAPATFQQPDKNLVWVASRARLCYSQSVLAPLLLRIFNSKHQFKNVPQGLQKKTKKTCQRCCLCRHVKIAFTRIPTHKDWPVVMAAGTSEPDLAGTCYPSVWRDSKDSAEVTFSRKRRKLLTVVTVASGRPSWFIDPLPAAATALNSRRRRLERDCCKSSGHWPVKDEMSILNGCVAQGCSDSVVKWGTEWAFLFYSTVNKLQGDLMESSSDEESGLQEEQNSASVLDMEDLGTIMNRAKKAKVRLKCLSVIVTRHSSRLQWWVGSGRSSGGDPGEQSGAGAACREEGINPVVGT